MGDPLYPASKLDGNQVLQHAFDTEKQRLRTDSVATVVNADIDIQLDASVDNVAIADGDGDQLAVNPDGSINVNVVSTGQQLYSYFTEVDNVATGVTTLLATYTAVSDVYLQKVELMGTNIAEFELVIDGVTQDKKRTFFNGNLENKFDFNAGLNILPGSVIEVYVIHNRPELGQFNARMQILQG
jgi:hypothetical protein